jgi:rhamnose utilization protein RhaD (predicted bifunctional aldolase and dehydrogenase)/NAD(P)-dependent dehydrogenase (short-subunit alcohol dehydrogenase family)
VRNRWSENEASLAKTDLALRAYSSRLIGSDPTLVLHGGGNTSVKSHDTDKFGDGRDIIWVKASGFDLAAMGQEGFTALDLSKLLKLANLEELSDEDMVNEVLCARLDAGAAAASVEAIVHGLIPFKYIDHSHADAILTISNSPNGKERFENIFGERVLILPYDKPGFDLALQFRNAMENTDLSKYEAVILENHGIFTFSDDARQSYEMMIKIVGEAETHLREKYVTFSSADIADPEPVAIARTRKAVGDLAGVPVISRRSYNVSADKVERFSALLRNGTVTPEHVIHNKPFPALLGEDVSAGLAAFHDEYTAYFERANDPNLTMLAPFPNWALFETGHCRSFGPNLKRAMISADVADTTLKAIFYADQMGGWQGLSEQDLRDLEYWELEQAKLKRQKPGSRLTGKIAVVSGAAAGIGQACAKDLFDQGAVVIGLDINPSITKTMSKSGFEGIVIDLTDEAAIIETLAWIVTNYGGLDIVVSNTGIFRTGAQVETLGDNDWDDTLSVNLTSHRKLLKQSIPYLRHGFDPGIVIIGSRNVAAPGAGAAAYSVSKAGLTQLMRVLALELAPEGITVNAVHPDAVFDTNLWTPETLAISAGRYNMSVDEYKTRNLLKTEIKSHHVARAVTAFVDGTLSKTTGAHLPVDGGNDRVV